MKDHSTFFFKDMESRILGLLNPEGEGAIIFENVGKYSVTQCHTPEKTCIFISLVCDKSVTTQNLAFLNYWYRKKCLQMHF
jgi:hypothetical protein